MAFIKRYWWLIAGGLGLAVVAFCGGRHCESLCGDELTPQVIVPVGIDSGPSDEATRAQLAEQERLAAQAIVSLEQKHREELERFNATQATEYAAVRERGPTAVAAWLTEFNRGLRDGGAR